MSDFNLDAFLAQQEAEGIQQGEQGSFTVSHSKAISKMAKFSLPREHAWVLKLVQAACGWDCAGLTLTQTRSQSTFSLSFKPGSELPTNKELVSALHRGSLESSEPIDSLATALRVLVEKCNLSFMLSIQGSEAIYAGVFFTELGDQSRVKWRAKWAAGITLCVHHIAHNDPNRLLLHYIPIRRHGLPMLAELDSFAYTSSVGITVDGRRIDGALASAAMSWGKLCKPLLFYGLNWPGLGKEQLALSEGFADMRFSVRTHPRKARRTRLGLKFFAAFFLLGIKLMSSRPEDPEPANQRSYIHWVRGGVIVHSELVTGHTAQLFLHAYASAEGLTTDLTGFQLVRDPTFLARRQAVIEAAAKALRDKCRDGLRFLEPDDDELSEGDAKIDAATANRQRWGRAKKGAAAGATLVPLSPPVGAAASVVGAFLGAFYNPAPSDPRVDGDLLLRNFDDDIRSLDKALKILAQG